MGFYNKSKTNGFKNFISDMKSKQLAKVLIVSGQEQYLTKWIFDHLVEKYVQKGWEPLDVAVFTDEIRPGKIIESLETTSIMSEKRIIWVKEYRHLLGEKSKGYSKDEMDNLINVLNHYNGENLIVFSFEEMDKIGPHIKTLSENVYKQYLFDKLSQTELNSFINKQFAAEGIAIPRDKVYLIVDLSGYYNRESGYRLYNLVNDIKKICAHAGNGQITDEDIIASMNGDTDIYVFDFIEALGNARREQAFIILSNMLATGDTVFHLMPLIVGQFELMLQIQELLGEGKSLQTIARELKVHEFRAKKAMQLASKFPQDKLKELLLNAYEIDIQIKLGDIDQRVALELLIAKI